MRFPPAFELRVRTALLPLPIFVAAASLVTETGTASRFVGGEIGGTTVGKATGFPLPSTVAPFLDAALFAGVAVGLGGTVGFIPASVDVVLVFLDAAAAATAAAVAAGPFWVATEAEAGPGAGVVDVLALAGESILMPTFDGRFPEVVAEVPSRLVEVAGTGGAGCVGIDADA